jgi:hypothetical protein
MPLLSTQNYVRGLLDNLPVPGQTKPMDFYTTAPVLQDMDGPHGYVSGARVASVRQTAPRIRAGMAATSAGYRKNPWKIEIYAVYETNADRNPTLDSEFPAILDAITYVLETTQMPQWIDEHGTPIPTNTPIPGATQIDAIGERWTLDYPPERTPATLRMLWYVALITVDVLEVVQR